MISTAVAWMAPICAIVGMLVALYLARWVLKQDPGPDKMNNISLKIQQGASAFLKSEYKMLAIFVVVVAVIMGVCLTWWTAAAFVTGAILSACAGYVGMFVATRANTRTTHAAEESVAKALNVSFKSGLTMGLCVASFALFGLSLWLILLVLLVIGFTAAFVRCSVHSRAKAALTAGLAVVILFLLSYSLSPLLTFTMYSPRHMYAFGLMIGLFAMSLSALSDERAVIGKAAVVMLSISFLSFAFIYGNALTQQKEYTDYRMEQVLAPLTEIVSERPDETYVVKIEGGTGYAPSIEMLPASLSMVQRLVTTSFSEYFGGWNATELYRYYGLPLRMAAPEEYPYFNDKEMECYKDDFYASIYRSGNYVLIRLKERSEIR